MNDTKKLSWLAALHVYLEPAAWRMLCLGFAAGLPLLLVLYVMGTPIRRRQRLQQEQAQAQEENPVPAQKPPADSLKNP